jgi:hypothetical protein
LIVIATVASLLEKPLMSVVAPVYAEDHYGSAASFGAMRGRPFVTTRLNR